MNGTFPFEFVVVERVTVNPRKRGEILAKRREKFQRDLAVAQKKASRP